MLYIFPAPQHPRAPVELIFQGVYQLALLFHAISIVTFMTSYFVLLKGTMPDYYGADHGELVSEAIRTVMKGCTYEGQLHLGPAKAEITADISNVTYGMMTAAQLVTAIFVIEFLVLVLDAVSMSLYKVNHRHVRICSVHVPIYHFLVISTWVLLIAIIIISWVFVPNMLFFKRTLEHCANRLKEADLEAYMYSGYDGYTLFSLSTMFPFCASCLQLLGSIAGIIALMINSNHRAQRLLSEADAPWEARGPLCATSESLLALHTAQRHAILDDTRTAMEAGEEVRIVRSYQLMTEEDFNGLVEAMKEQVAHLLKEKQFENMKDALGADAAPSDLAQFAWRHQLPGRHDDMEVEPACEGGVGGTMPVHPGGFHPAGDGSSAAFSPADAWSPGENHSPTSRQPYVYEPDPQEPTPWLGGEEVVEEADALGDSLGSRPQAKPRQPRGAGTKKGGRGAGGGRQAEADRDVEADELSGDWGIP